MEMGLKKPAGCEPSSAQVILATHLHFPGFSQNPFSVLHAALHSQPQTETAAVTTHTKHSKTVKYSAVSLYLTGGKTTKNHLISEKMSVIPLGLLKCLRGMLETTDYLLLFPSRPELRPPR